MSGARVNGVAGSEKIAILDAGAQYGKVINASFFTVSVCRRI